MESTDCNTNTPCSTNATLCATVCQVENCALLVCDHCTKQEVLVHTPKACCFCCGECVCVHYSGAMTMSIPPQVTATCIHRTNGCCC